MSTKKYYNINLIITSAQNVQKVRFMPHGKRYKKYQNSLRRNTSHPLWWDVSNPVVLQKTQDKMDPAKVCQTPSEEQPLYNRGITFSPTPYHNSWFRPVKFNPHIAIQRFIPSNSWTKEFSKCYYSATLPIKTNSSGIKTDTFSPRSPSPENILLSQKSHQCNLRFRLNHSNRIWQTREGYQRLQSTQTWKTFVSPPALLRSSHSRLPTREVSFRRTHRLRKKNIHRRGLIQITYSYLQNKSARRCQMVRPRSSSSTRAEQNKLCHRSQGQPAYPTSSWRTALSRVQKRLGGSRISVSTSPIQASSFHCSTKTPAREKQQSTHAIYPQEACLSRSSYKSNASSGKCLEILLRPSRNRTKYQRTKVGLLSFQDTHKKLFSKQSIFSSSFIRLQYRKLVQKIMSARTISICYIANYPQRTFSVAGAISKIWQQKFTQITKAFYLHASLRLCN